MKKRSKRYLGFTMVEMIITIVIMGIVSLGIISFLNIGAKGYIKSVDRERMQSKARFAILRMKRELQHAVPNSVFESDDLATKKCLSFTPIVAGGTYFPPASGTLTEELSLYLLTPARNFKKGEYLAVINPLTNESLRPASTGGISAAGLELATDFNWLGADQAATQTMNFTLAPSSASPANRIYIYGTGTTSLLPQLSNFCVMKNGDLIYESGLPPYQSVLIGRGINYDNSSFTVGDTTMDESGAIANNMGASNLVRYQLGFENENSKESSIYTDTVQILNRP